MKSSKVAMATSILCNKAGQSTDHACSSAVTAGLSAVLPMLSCLIAADKLIKYGVAVPTYPKKD